ncbi:hypothetical protein K523DRAFT_77525 [Schizophyllum commune Tattone D]|nr:hypothetical protein K523DRAFT_77525 [Schizophyllum commune Tattone D]
MPSSSRQNLTASSPQQPFPSLPSTHTYAIFISPYSPTLPSTHSPHLPHDPASLPANSRSRPLSNGRDASFASAPMM